MNNSIINIFLMCSFFCPFHSSHAQNDTLFRVDYTENNYSFKRKAGDIVSVSNYLHGYITDKYEFYIEIPKDYKKVSLYIDNDIEPTITIYDVKKGYEPIFLPTDCKVIWAIMDGDVYERTIKK